MVEMQANSVIQKLQAAQREVVQLKELLKQNYPNSYEAIHVLVNEIALLRQQVTPGVAGPTQEELEVLRDENSKLKSRIQQLEQKSRQSSGDTAYLSHPTLTQNLAHQLQKQEDVINTTQQSNIDHNKELKNIEATTPVIVKKIKFKRQQNKQKIPTPFEIELNEYQLYYASQSYDRIK